MLTATWVKRYPNDEDSCESEKPITNLTTTQKEKLSHLFSHIFDMDRDDIISLQDFESFSEVMPFGNLTKIKVHRQTEFYLVNYPSISVLP